MPRYLHWAEPLLVALHIRTAIQRTRIMENLKILLILGLAVATGGCAAHPDPIVDLQGVNPGLLAQDWDDCEGYSEEIIIGAGVAKGAGLGGAVGAASGTINGNVSRSAANGALIGATRSGLGADREKQQVFKRCLRGRGYRVLN
jgi:outer membrane lipoprotein SlyB